jgi:protein-serine/threonine kinase
LILERVAGGELFDLISTRHNSLAEREWLVRLLFGEMANAVGWMHSINLVHRDIKLENIILTHQLFASLDPLKPSTLPRSPLLKISDFGLSRFVDPASPLLDTRCGSEEYAAPELIIGKRYDGRKTDVWALGVVLYSLLSGSLPFLSSQEDHHSIAKGYSRERAVAEQQGSLARKAHLLRIAKGDLRWPSHTNEASLDQVEIPCPPSHRLITPLARRLVARLIRRDAAKRASAWEAWDEEWLTKGSIPNEASANGEPIVAPLDPRTSTGQDWLSNNARVQRSALEITQDD